MTATMIFHTLRWRQEVLFLMMMVVIVLTNPAQVSSFSTISQSTTQVRSMLSRTVKSNPRGRSTSSLFAIEDEDEGEVSIAIQLGDSESTLLGITGIIASIIMLYSESVLFRTGCGLPAGPLGLVGAAEGISYLGVVVLVGCGHARHCAHRRHGLIISRCRAAALYFQTEGNPPRRMA